MIFSGKRPENLGVIDGKLATCPDSPNCVSSQTNSLKHKIDPFTFSESPKEEILKLKNILDDQKGITVIKSDQNYIYAECRTPLMSFIDDLEFYWNNETKVCHVRSASRLGHSDFGKNRSRVEEIRSKFNIDNQK